MWRKTLKFMGVSAILLIILLIGLNGLMPSRSADSDAVTTANSLVDVGELDEAVEIYRQLIEQGVRDSVVFYNLGNIYYQMGDLGHAIINYNRAAQLAPRDPDIRANLEIARGQIADPFLESDPGLLGALAGLTDGWLNLNETAIVAVTLWFLAGLLFVGFRYLESGRLRTAFQYALLITVLLVVITGLSLGSRLSTGESLPEGVVVVPAIAVSSEPEEGYATDYSLFSGAEVRFVETRGGWIRLSMPDGALESWIPLTTVELVAYQPWIGNVVS